MRRSLILPLGALVVLAAAHTLLWQWAESRLDSGFDDWAKAQRQRGWTVTAARPARAGWPFHAGLDIANFAVAGGAADIPGGLEWDAERLGLSVSLFHPRLLAILPEGLQKLRLGTLPELPFRADTMTIEIPLDPGAPARRADLRATHLRVGVPHGDSADGVTLALMQAHSEVQPGAAQGEPALSFTGSAQDIGLPPPPAPPVRTTPNPAGLIANGANPAGANPDGANPVGANPDGANAPGAGQAGTTWPLGQRIASFSIEGALTGPVSRAADPRARAAAWRDGGGSFEIRRLATGWGPLGLSLSATLALDEQLQPMGAGTAHLVGQNEAVDSLAAAHVITTNAATAAKAVLGLIARVPDGGGTPEADVPLTLQNRTVAVGRIPLLKMPVLVWPTADAP